MMYTVGRSYLVNLPASAMVNGEPVQLYGKELLVCCTSAGDEGYKFRTTRVVAVDGDTYEHQPIRVGVGTVISVERRNAQNFALALQD